MRLITGRPSSKYEHQRASALLHNIQNIRICMGKKPIVSITYENERISIKNSLPYLKCVTSLLCGPRADLWSFYGFLCKPFSLDIKVYQGWAFQRSGSTDPPKENGRKFAPTAPIASKFHLSNTWQFHSLSCFKMPLHGERIKGRKSLQPFPSEAIIWGSAWTPRYIVYFKCIWIMLWKLILLLVFDNSYFIRLN